MTGRCCRDQRLGDRRHRLRIRAAPEARRLLVFGDQRVGDFLAQDVGRELDQHRAGAAVLDRREGAPQRLDRRVGDRDLLRQFRDVAEIERRVEVRMDLVDVAGIAGRQHDDRAGIAVGLRDAAERVLGAGPVLHDEDADLVARAELADGIAHMQPDALLAHHDRADIGLGRPLDDRVDRIADQPLDPLLFQDLGDRVGDLHRAAPLLGCDGWRSPYGIAAGVTIGAVARTARRGSGRFSLSARLAFGAAARLRAAASSGWRCGSSIGSRPASDWAMSSSPGGGFARKTGLVGKPTICNPELSRFCGWLNQQLICSEISRVSCITNPKPSSSGAPPGHGR